MKTNNKSNLTFEAKNLRTRSLVRSFKINLKLTCLIALGAFILVSPEALAVKAGEMKTSVDYLTGLLDNNIVPAILIAGIVAGAAFAFLKSSFGPLVLAICTIIGYGFAHKWVTTVYSLCI